MNYFFEFLLDHEKKINLWSHFSLPFLMFDFFLINRICWISSENKWKFSSFFYIEFPAMSASLKWLKFPAVMFQSAVFSVYLVASGQNVIITLFVHLHISIEWCAHPSVVNALNRQITFFLLASRRIESNSNTKYSNALSRHCVSLSL